MKQLQQCDLAFFFRQFATLIQAGVPLLVCYDILATSNVKPDWHYLLYQLKKHSHAGKTLYQGFTRYPQHFDHLICHLIKIGEKTGKLDETLFIIADFLEKRVHLTKQIKQALFYPTMVLLTGIVLTYVMLLVVIPNFISLFTDYQQQLPYPTQMIFKLSTVVQDLSWYIVLMVLLFCLSCQKFKSHYQRFLIRCSRFMPLVKGIQHQLFLTRFATQLAIALRAGVPILDALQLIQDRTTNAHLIQTLITNVQAGYPLHQAMGKVSGFPPMMMQMIKVGETSGTLDQMIHRTGQFMATETQHRIEQLTRYLEPLIMLLLGVVIGGLVISLYLPIFKLGTLL